ncbi:MAG: 23S rRNA (uracil(1939)-C(5))-methyltransferase RlmD [Eubacterium sp.]|nr:23S rRNA (uracil(1939)-C(5))-methyltransferase RlmD [Eubacterium sp.]
MKNQKINKKDRNPENQKPYLRDQKAAAKMKPQKTEPHTDGEDFLKCPVYRKCGGCEFRNITYEEQLKVKENRVRKELEGLARTEKIAGMSYPYFYRNKVNAAFQRKRDGSIVSGVYEAGTHRVVPVERCLIEDQRADRIIGTIRRLAPSFRITIYNENSGYGLLRHVMVRVGHKTGQILVTLVVTSPIFPSKNNFVKALRKEHPEITSIVLNLNEKNTSMVLGERNIVLYGKGYIEDILCGKKFRISPSSFYQINSIQTEVLYRKAIELAALTGREKVFDAYSGIGTIGIAASGSASEVTCVELNADAVRDARYNARMNGVRNIRFYQDDAGRFLERMAAAGEKVDVLFMDPPRSGSTETFIDAVSSMKPERIVYISCNPETLARDLRSFRKRGYRAGEAYPVDMFAWSGSIETVVALQQ